MKQNANCPLCGANETSILETLNTKSLARLWEYSKVNASDLFRNHNVISKLLCSNCELIFFYPFIQGDDYFYSKLGEEDWYYLHEDKTEYNYSENFINDGDSVLDIGSGRGAFYRNIHKKISYLGLELSSRAITDAQRDDIKVIQTRIEDYAKNHKSVHDVVVAFQVLEHIANIDTFIKSSLYALKTNGLLIIAVPNNNSFLRLTVNNVLNLPPHHLIHWTESSLKFIAQKHQLEIVDLYKERVTNIHKKWYYETTLVEWFCRMTGVKQKSFNNSIGYRLIRKASGLISKLASLTNLHKRQDGHTIAIVLRKLQDE